MANDNRELVGPDLSLGVDPESLNEGEMVLGHVDGERVLLARSSGGFFALSATCSHYGGNLAEGLLVGDTVRCPLHHACFDLRTGEAMTAPALDAIACWKVERKADRLYVIGKAPARTPEASPAPPDVAPIVIIGGGAAGLAAAEALRREGYCGKLTLLSAEQSPPTDRPNFKHYLSGEVPEEWIPLRPPSFFVEHEIDLVLGARVAHIDPARRMVALENGAEYPYQRLLLATGADPVKLSIPGAELAHVHSLRTLEDSRAILAGSASGKRAVVIGASFIGLETAAALRTRGLEVDVVAPEARPLERVLGAALGDFVRDLHEAHGVRFHLGLTPSAIDAQAVTLSDGQRLPADLVVVGVGVRPNLSLAEKAGILLDRGVLVNEYLETSARFVYAAGDIARWPDPHSGQKIRVEHWVVAQRHGQIAARNMLGKQQACEIVPFFWTRQYDVSICYVGHAERWDQLQVDGCASERDCKVSYRLEGRTLAVATIGRDITSLRAELELAKF